MRAWWRAFKRMADEFFFGDGTYDEPIPGPLDRLQSHGSSEFREQMRRDEEGL